MVLGVPIKLFLPERADAKFSNGGIFLIGEISLFENLGPGIGVLLEAVRKGNLLLI